MYFERLYAEELAQASYLIGCQATGEAMVIDANRDIDTYIAAAARRGLRITAVTETHIHADYVSGSRALAQRTGATLYLSAEGPPEWQYAFASEAELVRDGDVISLGNLRIEVMHTPGHTPEHISFVLTDTPAGAQPVGIFTGDFVFVGDVGRPDLLEKAAGIKGTMEAGARQLFKSLQRFKALPDHLQLWPGHGAGSACGRALGAVPQSSVGYEKLYNWALQIPTEDGFVAEVLSGQPAPPSYFATMKRVNRDGIQPMPTAPLPELSRAELDGLTLVDARPADQFAAGHLDGALSLAGDGPFLQWAGWLLQEDDALALIAAPEQVAPLRRLLSLIGIDNVRGVVTPATLAAWQTAGVPQPQLERRPAQELGALVGAASPVVVDVRTAEEFAAGHVPGSRNLPLHELLGRLGELPDKASLLVHCQAGSRSPIAASILQAAGWPVIEMRDGMEGWSAAGLKVAY